MDAGVAAVIGAAIGAGGASLAALIALRAAQYTANQQRRAMREQWLRQIRRDAYARFLAEMISVSNLLERAEPGTVEPLPDTVAVELGLAALLIEAPLRVHPVAGAVAEALNRQVHLHASSSPADRAANRRDFYDAVHQFIEASRSSLN